ncbi:MAG: saccharopine dehydrogenase [NADP(+) L-glutamate-forming] [Lasallia pustulata]|uniref:Saccharopine dehydrogenase [NADP(+) L-glutamate-forming] n=1 Tax=Lasallia pustulata TaxID=136370 RepID=A0A5M8PTF9_9LECA|nr:MAG: saccharopine dehydrogenase [NADP(+) L-glutamate-forming] [Lasallia pustulata]
MAGSKKVLLLGAGFVTKPTVQILSNADIEVTVGLSKTETPSGSCTDKSAACRTPENSKNLSQGIKNAHPISLDVTNAAALDAAVEKVDVVVSSIPYTFHATVIKSAIRKKKNVVTSYVSPAMLELESKVKEAGITVMNEIGLDPGIDHLYAVKTIGQVITSFLFYCGGLPAPEASDNPLGYKFSWSSRVVLLALTNTAKYYKDGKIEEVAGPELMGTAKPYFIYPATSGKESDIEWAISSKTKFADNDEKNRIFAGLPWIGMFSEDKITPRGTPLDTLCTTLEQKIQYGSGERDLVTLQHKFEIEHKDGRKETRTSTLVDYGDHNGYSSMAKLVGAPCEIAVKQVLDGTISEKGILAPMSPKTNNPLIEELKKYGIELKEQTLA